MQTHTPTIRSCALLCLACLTTLLAASGCGRKASGEAPADFAVEVVLEKPVVTAVEDTLTAVGTIEANERVDLRPESSGLIEKVLYEEGRRVTNGQTLFVLNSRKETAAVDQARAEEELARLNVERARTLASTKAISQQELDRLESELEIRTANRTVQRERLADRTVTAPFDGVLGPRLVSPGQYVTPETLLGILVDDSVVKVRIRIPERKLSLVRLRQEARLAVTAYPDRSFNGTVDLISPEVDEVTRTVEVRLVSPNPDGLLKSGMFARVNLITDTRSKSLVIPEGALVPSLDEFSVYVADEGVARLQPVKLGVRLPGRVEVREGLDPGQSIVVSGVQKVFEGAKLVETQTSAPRPQAAAN